MENSSPDLLISNPQTYVSGAIPENFQDCNEMQNEILRSAKFINLDKMLLHQKELLKKNMEKKLEQEKLEQIEYYQKMNINIKNELRPELEIREIKKEEIENPEIQQIFSNYTKPVNLMKRIQKNIKQEIQEQNNFEIITNSPEEEIISIEVFKQKSKNRTHNYDQEDQKSVSNISNKLVEEIQSNSQNLPPKEIYTLEKEYMWPETPDNLQEIDLLWERIEGQKFKCLYQGCESIIKGLNKIRSHIRTQLNRRLFVCVVQSCQKIFNYRSIMFAHMVKFHNITNQKGHQQNQWILYYASDSEYYSQQLRLSQSISKKLRKFSRKRCQKCFNKFQSICELEFHIEYQHIIGQRYIIVPYQQISDSKTATQVSDEIQKEEKLLTFYKLIFQYIKPIDLQYFRAVCKSSRIIIDEIISESKSDRPVSNQVDE